MNTQRAELVARLFPEGIPGLWCPPLTHYRPDGSIDVMRIGAHLRFMSSWAKGFLVPGTTGDAWELTPEETQRVIQVVLDVVSGTDLHVLLGALHPDADVSRKLIRNHVEMLKQHAGTSDLISALTATRVCGFAVCPPRGERLSQDVMRDALASTLDLGVPLALYQLPQFTQNEMSPELVRDLAARFPNLILFKDTSGGDRVALAGMDLGGVYLTRGMEGGYAKWLKAGGGPYDGFLLSTANSFGAQLAEVRQRLEAGDATGATELSDRLARVVDGLFEIVTPARGGNKFANANKLADHFNAHGPRAAGEPPPRLHSGQCLTSDMVRTAGCLLETHGFMPTTGYLE